VPVLTVPTGMITGQVVNAQSQAVAGALVIAKLNAGNFVPQSIAPAGQVVPQEVSTFTLPDGSWSLSLVNNNNITPANTTYTISVQGMPDVQIVLLDTASHPYMSLVVSGTGATLQPVAQTIAGNLIVSGTLAVQSLTVGQVVFPIAGGVLSGDPNLFWDNVNKRLGVGTSAPSQGGVHISVPSGANTLGLTDTTPRTWAIGPTVGGVVNPGGLGIFDITVGQTRFGADAFAGSGSLRLLAGGHIRSTGPTPTISGVNAGISGTPIVAGNDRCGIITLTTTGAPPGAQAILFTVNFSVAYTQANPVVFVCWNSFNVAGALTTISAQSVGTTSFQVVSGQSALTANSTYQLAYLVEEHSP
jgi:hypothetical protein